MIKTLGLVATILLFLNSCSKPSEPIHFDFIGEFSNAKTIFPVKRIEPLKSWNTRYRHNGWVRNPRQDKEAILIPGSRKRAIFLIGSLNREEKEVKFLVRALLPTTFKNLPELKILINGHEVYSSPLDWKDYKEISILAKKEILVTGENFFEFQLYPHEFDLKDNFWLALKNVTIDEQLTSFSSASNSQEIPNRITVHKTLFRKKQGIEQILNTALSYEVKIPRNARLKFNFTLKKPKNNIASGEKLSVLLDTSDGRCISLYENELAKKSHKKNNHVDLDLSPYENQMARISFVFQKDSKDQNFSARLRLWEPRIEIQKEGFKTSESSNEFDKNPILAPFNILIYLNDCLRPDHLPFFGYKKNLAPNMAEFAKDSIVFKKAYAQGPWTRPSIGSLFTGFHPSIHKAISLQSGLSSEFITLAEILNEAGFHTAGISSNAGIKEYFNFDQGFEYFMYHSNLQGGLSYKLNEYAILQLQEKKSPFFLYIHTMDSHRPYMIKKEFTFDVPVESFDPNKMVTARKGEEDKYQVDLQHVLALYDASIRQIDKSFGDLINEMKSLGLYDNTMILLMSDHGEEFYDHGGFAHGSTLYQEVLHQLLVIKLPRQIMAGKVVNENVQEIDILPTILDLIGETKPDYLLGKSMKNLLFYPKNNNPPLHGEIFAETGINLRKKALIDGHWKLIHTGEEWRDFPEEYELYNLEDDPGEKNNLFLRNPVVTEYYKRRLKEWAQTQKELSKLGTEALLKTLSEKDIEELRALGYIR